MEYKECKVITKLHKKSNPLISKVPCDEYTQMVQNNFDYEFTGESQFYPYELPKELNDIDFNIMAIVGASGSGKSTLLKEFDCLGYSYADKHYDSSKAIVSNFNTPKEASFKLSAVGLNSMPVWCRPRNVLSVGEGFRADIALNLESNMIFDEFTSTIDRNVAKSTCNGLQKYIRSNNLHNMIFCSCHKDYIPYLQPDIVVDLDDEYVYDCRGVDLKKASLFKCTAQPTKTFGEYLGSITI
jgi:ABC-type glutathione transport system ATPase component